MFKVTKRYYDSANKTEGNAFLHIETNYGIARASVTDKRIYWADNGFWCNWTKIKELKRVESGRGTYGDTQIYLPDVCEVE